MIHLMLNAHRKQTKSLYFGLVAVPIERADTDMLETPHGLVDSRHRKTTLLGNAFIVRRNDLRVDQHHRLTLVVGYIGNENSLMHIDLGRRESYARGRVHRLEHVVDQHVQCCIHVLDRRQRLLFSTGFTGVDHLNMTHLALHHSNYVNGVAKQHGKISRDMFPEQRIDAEVIVGVIAVVGG